MTLACSSAHASQQELATAVDARLAAYQEQLDKMAPQILSLYARLKGSIEARRKDRRDLSAQKKVTAQVRSNNPALRVLPLVCGPMERPILHFKPR